MWYVNMNAVVGKVLLVLLCLAAVGLALNRNGLDKDENIEINPLSALRINAGELVYMLFELSDSVSVQYHRVSMPIRSVRYSIYAIPYLTNT